MRTRIRRVYKHTQKVAYRWVAGYVEKMTFSIVTIYRVKIGNRPAHFLVRSIHGRRVGEIRCRSSRVAKRDARLWMNRFRSKRRWLRAYKRKGIV
jgi:hypothetical protein